MLRNAVMMMVLCAAMTAMSAGARAATAEDARQFVDNMGKRVLSVMNGPGDHDSKQKALRQMFSNNVDINWMGRFVIGRGWQQASAAQRNQYLNAYRQYLLARYTSNFADYTGSKYTITGVRDDGNGQFTVNMQIKTPDSNGQQQNTLAGYRVRASEDGQFRIVDIIIEGVSLLTTQRADFSSVLQQQGVSGLISAIENKTQTEKAAGWRFPSFLPLG